MRYLALALLCAACASKQKIAEVPAAGPVPLRLKASNGQETTTAYHFSASTEEFESGQKTKDRQENVDFKVRGKFKDVKEDRFTSVTETVDKQGVIALHGFAFPEPGESIDFIYSTDAHVLKADPFPKESIFYMPPISLPQGNVGVGDTWTLDHAWISGGEGLPLKLSMVTIFKGIVTCRSGQCADLEVSGKVNLPPSMAKSVDFNSKIWGRMLFSLSRGDVLWSEVQSEENVAAGGKRTKVKSCMSSMISEGKKKSATCSISDSQVKIPTEI